MVASLLSALSRVTEETTQIELVWLLSYISAAPTTLQKLLQSETREGGNSRLFVVEKVVGLFLERCEDVEESVSLLVPLIRTVSNFVCCCGDSNDTTGRLRCYVPCVFSYFCCWGDPF